MYTLKLITKDEDIIEFEKRMNKSFRNSKKVINNISQCTYSEEIKKGDILAFLCMEKEKVVGGMMVELRGRELFIRRLFVEDSERDKGIGSFMINYLITKKSFFEDYYAEDINGILAEPLDTSMDFYYKNGFDSFGYQMYKRY